MTRKSIFRFTDYKAYLEAYERESKVRGFRSRLAECTNCQNAFISQVLNGDVNFSLEQGIAIAIYLNLKSDERQYFLWMIEWKRAGTSILRDYFNGLMSELREKNLQIKERALAPQVLSQEAQTIYYSSWIYSAVHIAVMIPALNTESRLERALDVSAVTIKNTVEFLVQHGLIERSGGHLKSGRVQIHLSNDSANIAKLHTNWRIEALKSLDRPAAHDLHYSGVSSLSKSDAIEIRAMFTDMLENYFRTVERSPEETLYTLNLDFFTLIRD